MGFAGGWMSPVGDDVVAVLEVRGEHAVVSGEMARGRGTERARYASGTSGAARRAIQSIGSSTT